MKNFEAPAILYRGWIKELKIIIFEHVLITIKFRFGRIFRLLVKQIQQKIFWCKITKKAVPFPG
jgi:hypothetical protein